MDCARDNPTQSWAVFTELSGQLVHGVRELCCGRAGRVAGYKPGIQVPHNISQILRSSPLNGPIKVNLQQYPAITNSSGVRVHITILVLRAHYSYE